MTTKETAEALNVSESTVQRHAKELGLTENGKATTLDEKAVTIIKTRIERSGRSDLRNVAELPNVSTDLEMMIMDQRVMEWKTRRIEELQKKLSESEARTQRLIHNNTTYTTSEIAKELNMVSPQELNSKLRDKGIQHKDARGVWLLNAEYSGKGFQNIKQGEKNGHIIYYSEWTGIGRDWIIGMFSKEVNK